jgi:hypothetical protein
MKRSRHKPGQTIRKLRDAGMLAAGRTVDSRPARTPSETFTARNDEN